MNHNSEQAKHKRRPSRRHYEAQRVLRSNPGIDQLTSLLSTLPKVTVQAAPVPLESNPSRKVSRARPNPFDLDQLGVSSADEVSLLETVHTPRGTLRTRLPTIQASPRGSNARQTPSPVFAQPDMPYLQDLSPQPVSRPQALDDSGVHMWRFLTPVLPVRGPARARSALKTAALVMVLCVAAVFVCTGIVVSRRTVKSVWAQPTRQAADTLCAELAHSDLTCTAPQPLEGTSWFLVSCSLSASSSHVVAVAVCSALLTALLLAPLLRWAVEVIDQRNEEAFGGKLRLRAAWLPTVRAHLWGFLLSLFQPLRPRARLHEASVVSTAQLDSPVDVVDTEVPRRHVQRMSVLLIRPLSPALSPSSHTRSLTQPRTKEETLSLSCRLPSALPLWSIVAHGLFVLLAAVTMVELLADDEDIPNATADTEKVHTNQHTFVPFVLMFGCVLTAHALVGQAIQLVLLQSKLRSSTKELWGITVNDSRVQPLLLQEEDGEQVVNLFPQGRLRFCSGLLPFHRVPLLLSDCTRILCGVVHATLLAGVAILAWTELHTIRHMGHIEQTSGSPHCWNTELTADQWHVSCALSVHSTLERIVLTATLVVAVHVLVRGVWLACTLMCGLWRKLDHTN